MQITWQEILGYAFEFVLLPLFGLAVLYLANWIKTKKQELLEKTKNETVKSYIEMLDKTITDCVLATKQTYVDVLKATGKFDAEAQKKAFQQTYDAITALLTDEAQRYIGEAVKDINAYITTKIEAQVGVTKK